MDQIYTTKGYVDPSILEKKVIVSDEPQAHITATEYWLEGVPIEWGGDWPKLRDGPHYQLPHAMYPKPREKSNA